MEFGLLPDYRSPIILEVSVPEYPLCLFEILVEAYCLHVPHTFEGLGALMQPSIIGKPI